MEERHAKRPKVDNRGEDGYMPGNIVEIEIHNFMTYDHLKCKPGPRLNLVIGPNGSGKSSLVCAIALGLAGEPQLLGRASSIGAYVKRGEESGWIKISLRGTTSKELFCIKRRITTQNRSEWLVNGKNAVKRDVVELIQRFNIQVNNLTQFLPQDRVCEFAKLTPIQLLEETEKAVGDPGLPVQHNALIDKSREIKKLEVAVKQNTETLDQLKALNAEQEKDVERVRQREQLLAKVESMKKKLPWLKYDMKKMEYLKAKELESEAKKELDEAAKILSNLSKPIEERKKQKGIHDSACKKVSNATSLNCAKRMEHLEMENQLGVKIRAKYDEMVELKRLEESRQQRISKAREDLAAAELELANLPLYEPPSDEMKRLENQIVELHDAARERRAQMADIESILSQKKAVMRQCVDRLRSMENANMKLLQALKNSGAEKIVEAYEWLQRHRSELNKEVYGPVLLEVNIPNRVHASYLEEQVPYYIWKSFITQDPADRDYMVRGLKSFDIPVLNYVAHKGHQNTKFSVSEEMHGLGIYSRLDQVFDAPAAVKEVLTSQAGLDRSYIGSTDTDKRADEVSRLGILDLWTPDNHYRWSISRYGGHVSAVVEQVVPSRLFLSSVDAAEVERFRLRRKELEEEIGNLEESFKASQTELRQLDDEAAKLHKVREEIVNCSIHEKKKRRDMESRVAQRKMKLTSIKKEGDIDTSIKKLSDQVTALNMQRFQNAIEIKNLLSEAVAFKCSFAEKHMTSIELEIKIREMELSLKQQEKTAVQATMRFEHCRSETENFRKQLSAAKIHAESISVITPELQREFLKMPCTIEDLEAAIQDNISQANSILFLNQNILEEYESRQQKIDAIAKKLESDSSGLNNCLSEIESLKGKWLPTLRTLVAKINETFGRNFQEMAVAGEVSLDEHNMDFDKFGILIKVKFRQAGQLQVLSAHHQSGGERSVSTILYLVSLQDLTNCPFRVVDEINQGMDPINERKMFQQLVRASSQPNTPQCFLLTPKLLPDLEYSNACSILNIMNGPWIEKPAEAWSSGGCWREVMGLSAEA